MRVFLFSLDSITYFPFTDESLPVEMLVDKMLTTFERVRAATGGKNSEVHPIVWVEDIHSCEPQIAARISTALLTIGPKVVHTVSEDSGFNMLKGRKLLERCERSGFLGVILTHLPLASVSGHARRLKNIPFQLITEEEIVAAISKPFTEIKRVTNFDSALDGVVDDFEELTRPAVCDLDVAEYIVSILGNNLGQIDDCLGNVGVSFNGIVEKLGMAKVKSKL